MKNFLMRKNKYCSTNKWQKRGVINTEKDISEENLIKELLSSKTFDKFLKDNKIKKQFYVKNRLINFLL